MADVTAHAELLIEQIEALRSFFIFHVEFGDVDGLEIAFNSLAQIAYGAIAVLDPSRPLVDPTRPPRDFSRDEV
jgi:hypothetical protein